MTDVLKDVIQRGWPVAAFAVHEHWVDIGCKTDLERLQRDLAGPPPSPPVAADLVAPEHGEA